MKYTLTGVIVAALVIAGWNYVTNDPYIDLATDALVNNAPTCDGFDLDHLNYLRRLDAEKESVRQSLSKLKPSSEYFAERKAVLNRKLSFVEASEAFVEKYVRHHDTSYACIDDGYRIFLEDLHVVSIQDIIRQQEMQWLQNNIKYRWSVGRVLEMVFAPFVLILLTVIGWVLDKKFSK